MATANIAGQQLTKGKRNTGKFPQLPVLQWTEHGLAPWSVPRPERKRTAEKAEYYGASLGLHLDRSEEVILCLKAGLAFTSFTQLCRQLAIPELQLAAVSNIALRTLTRRKREGRLHPDESERVFRLAALFDHAVQVLGNVETARQWFETAKKALGGRAPLDYADTEFGAREVDDSAGPPRTWGVFVKRTAWRIVAAQHRQLAFSGQGASWYPGRWNSRGTSMIYTASSLSLAALELLVHLEKEEVLKFYLSLPVCFDDALCRRLAETELPTDWADQPIPGSTRALGDRWAQSNASLVLAVPSALVPTELNFLINPLHPDFPQLELGSAADFHFDPRLLKKPAS